MESEQVPSEFTMKNTVSLKNMVFFTKHYCGASLWEFNDMKIWYNKENYSKTIFVCFPCVVGVH